MFQKRNTNRNSGAAIYRYTILNYYEQNNKSSKKKFFRSFTFRSIFNFSFTLTSEVGKLAQNKFVINI